MDHDGQWSAYATSWTLATNTAGGVHGPPAHWDHRTTRGRALGRLGPGGCAVPAHLHPRGRARGWYAGDPAAGPPGEGGRADRRAGRGGADRGNRRQPGPVRSRAARADPPPRPPSRPVKADPDAGGDRGGPAGAG